MILFDRNGERVGLEVEERGKGFLDVVSSLFRNFDEIVVDISIATKNSGFLFKVLIS